MNIYAQHGHKVIFKHPRAGHTSDQQRAALYLVEGQTYTVKYTDVDNWYTDVYLVEIPNIGVHFNSVMFEDA